jgi:hypothetical protein
MKPEMKRRRMKKRSYMSLEENKTLLNRIPVMAPISAPILGDIFLGAFLPQKWDDLPPF